MWNWAARLVVLGCLLGVGHASYEGWVGRQAVKTCLAQQRRLQSQIDNLGSANVDVPMDDIWGRLVAAGSVAGQMGRSSTGAAAVLSLEIEDPGGGPGSYKNYCLMAGSRNIGCAVHGSASFGNQN